MKAKAKGRRDRTEGTTAVVAYAAAAGGGGGGSGRVSESAAASAAVTVVRRQLQALQPLKELTCMPKLEPDAARAAYTTTSAKVRERVEQANNQDEV